LLQLNTKDKNHVVTGQNFHVIVMDKNHYTVRAAEKCVGSCNSVDYIKIKGKAIPVTDRGGP
jgi:predicted RNA methylase